MEQKQHPLIIVFYLDVDLMKNPDIIGPFSDAINDMLHAKDVNALAFFIPTEGEERVECINPVIVPEVEMAKINKIIEDIKKNFSIEDDLDIQEPTTKPCECQNNPGGSCQC